MTTNNLQDDVRTVNSAFMAAVARGDTAAMTEAYTTEGQVLPPNGEIVAGKQNIQAFWQAVLDGFGVKSAAMETVELSQNGDTAYEVGKFLLQDAAGNQLDQGKYVVIWKLEDGRWKWYRDIFNSSLPLST